MRSKILVDGNCVVCDLEVSHYKRIAPDLFDIVDISAPGFDSNSFGLQNADVQKHLHVITESGKVVRGVDAFSYIWEQIPRYRFAASLIRLPGISTLSRVGYEAFTVVRPFLPKKAR